MATQSASLTKKTFSKPHTLTSPMLIDVQNRTAKIYERRDVKPTNKIFLFLIDAFGTTVWLSIGAYVLIIIIYGGFILLSGHQNIDVPEFSFGLIINTITMAVYFLLQLLIGLLPAIGGMFFIYWQRKRYASLMAKQNAWLMGYFHGEHKISLQDLKSKKQRIFIGGFYRLKWDANKEHAKTLKTINAHPIFLKRKMGKKPWKKKIAYWVADLEYSRIPKTGRTDLYWI